MSVIRTNTPLLILQFMWCLSQISTSEGLRVGFLPPEIRQDIYQVTSWGRMDVVLHCYSI